MIGKIKGNIVSIEGNEGLIETASGLSYRVYLTQRVLDQITIGDLISVTTYLQVREDALILFGFADPQEYRLFQLLLGVSGVGPKTAFGVISATKPDELIEAVKKQDSGYLTHIPGLGKKTALKILLELSQKFKTEFKFEDDSDDLLDRTAVDALVSLGFKTQDAKLAISKLDQALSTEEKITAVLKTMSNRS